ncbi:TetR family transcriptional regulator [Bradyrhizobium sp. BEA-2-5]|uniref:TetR family transcriptional regulator n=1 Tax=Bradyrhizobium TaxID=374 RepID=UPI00397D36D1
MRLPGCTRHRYCRVAGVDAVVERAGVTKRSLYCSFAAKDDLAAACMRDHDLDFREKFAGQSCAASRRSGCIRPSRRIHLGVGRELAAIAPGNGPPACASEAGGPLFEGRDWRANPALLAPTLDGKPNRPAMEREDYFLSRMQ